jgi:ATP-binding cassette subfamily B protein
MSDTGCERGGPVATWLAMPFKAAPLRASGALLAMSVHALTGIVQLYGLKLLIDALLADDSLREPLLLLVGAAALGMAIDIAGSPLWARLNESMDAHVHHRLLDLTTGIPDIAHHEQAETADRLAQVRAGIRELQGTADFLINTVTLLVSGISLIGVLVAVHPLLLLLVAAAGLRLLVGRRQVQLELDAAEAGTERIRTADRLSDISESPRHVLEVRLGSLGGMLTDRIGTLHAEARQCQDRAAHRGLALQAGSRLLYGFCYAGAVMFVLLRAVHGQATVGDAALVLMLGTRVEGLAAGLEGQARGFGGMLRVVTHFRWLAGYAAEAGMVRSSNDAAPPAELRSGITLEAVSFHYPGTDRPVLNELNLNLPAGSAVALVGENGAGKTTLVKLLAGLYQPTAGRILIDSQPLAGTDIAAWRARTTAAFQDSVCYDLPVGQAVGLGDLPRIDDTPAIRDALRRARADPITEALPQGLDTQLGKRFTGGVDLSGGQWQRVALARAFMRESPLLLVLDEPSAAIDPEAERELFARFAEGRAEAVRSGGITVLVSHRLSTVRTADLIIVLHDGEVAETGTHSELVSGNGPYAELFNLQTRAYH